MTNVAIISDKSKGNPFLGGLSGNKAARCLDLSFFLRKFGPYMRLSHAKKKSIVIFYSDMKKTYLVPQMRVAHVGFEVNFLASPIGFDGSTGEDLDDPGEPFNPWS